MYSQIGLLQNRSNAEGLKTACQNFQSSVGALQDLKEIIDRHPQPNVIDLTSESVNLLTNLMLAQAQECVYEKVTI